MSTSVENLPNPSAPLDQRLFVALADGRFHSGERLARTLGVSRSAIWKAADRLRALGAEIHAVPRRGYRLARAATPLDASQVRARLSQATRDDVRAIDVVWSIDSTNAALLARGPPPSGRCDVLLAEYQTAGRGRRGREWLAPLGGALCLSMAWCFAQLPANLPSLSLVVGLAVRRAIEELGGRAPGLKWPNDLLAGNAKLGGILIEMRAENAGPALAVIGIGLNVALGSRARASVGALGTEPGDLRDLGLEADRNRLAAAVIAQCLASLRGFESAGLKPFLEEWRAADALRGRAITVHAPAERYGGLARGIDASGSLLIETSAGLRRVIAGEISVRAEG